MGFVKGFKKGQKDFGGDIAVIVNSVLLTIVYFIGVGLTSIVAKISGVRFMETKLGEKSYWTSLNLGKNKMEEYYRQF